MSAPDYHLDRISVDLIERLEGARRTWAHQPELAPAGLRRAAEEMVDRVVAEHNEIFGVLPQSEVLRKELLETFLPRYVHLALAQNAVELRGFGPWPGRELLSRIVFTMMGLFFSTIFDLATHHPLGIAFFGLALLAPFSPELHALAHRRRYATRLQEVVDDMGRIQAQAERYTLAEVSKAPPKRSAGPAKELQP